MTQQLNQLTVAEAAQAIATGRITSEALVRACLARIDVREDVVHAWAALDPDAALSQARACDSQAPRGPLHGVPIGIKDVLNTSDYPTQMGSPIYAGNRSRADASCVALLRAAGAIVLGKTVTCEFAGVAPGATTNPIDPERTPGGSSSGSAAAVADGMVPLALGTQTGGSVLRPASFCGLIGFKPTFGTINREGLKFAAESLDTIGLIGQTVEDIALVMAALTGPRDWRPRRLDTPPRLGLCKTYLWDEKASSETAECVDRAAAALRAAGASVEHFALPDSFRRLTAAREIINNVERARSLAWEWAHHRSSLSPQLVRTIELGLAVPEDDYRAALQLAEEARLTLDAQLAEFDGLVAPCVNGEAPVGLTYAGDPAFQAIWTLLHVPTMTIPAHRGAHGMPVGIQFVARRWCDDKLTSLALWAQEIAKFGMDLSK
jgi:Asp-tRNA(Asn)/Glu-tRNA(Gln) amidotransferase A subunit family amidase